MSELETLLETVDKSTISRTLNTFKERHLLHAFTDGSGSVKYEVCHSQNEEHDDMHVHFRCEKCGNTTCLSEIKVPEVSLPSGYRKHEVSYMISGICPSCVDKNEG